MQVSMTVNGEQRTDEVEPRTLLDALLLSFSRHFRLITCLHGSNAVTVTAPIYAGYSDRALHLALQRFHEMLGGIEVAHPARLIERRGDLVREAPPVARLRRVIGLPKPFLILERRQVPYSFFQQQGVCLEGGFVHVVHLEYKLPTAECLP